MRDMEASATEGVVSGWFEAGLSFIYPQVCQICKEKRATAAEGFVCTHCRQEVRLIKPPFCERCGLPYEGDITIPFECANCREMGLHFRTARSAAVTHGVVLEVIHRYKYQSALWFEPFLAELLTRAAVPELTGKKWDLLVPVPLFPTRKREREFNQAERLADRLGEAAGLPVRKDLVRRVVDTQTQTRLKRQQRAANVRHAFAASHPGQLHGERVVLVDDVFTTGATTSACAGVLLAAGAGEVSVWTVARGGL